MIMNMISNTVEKLVEVMDISELTILARSLMLMNP